MQNFQEFWPRYLRAHADPRTRTIHTAGTIAATTLMVAGALTRKPWVAAAALLAGYGPAWYSHAFIEHNKPETFSAPLESLAADYVMAWHVLRGTIDAEMERAGAVTV
jgi:hypothetical protein